jgi:hypothetical protein
MKNNCIEISFDGTVFVLLSAYRRGSKHSSFVKLEEFVEFRKEGSVSWS